MPVIKLHFFFIFIFIVNITSLFSQQKGTDELYISRLNALHSPTELIYQSQVKKYIDEYIDKPEKVKELISLSKIYFPLIERALKSKNVPFDLKYLAVAVSELDPSIQNSYGSSGLWMMGYNVSKMYKLKVNSFVDERKDVLKSSIAAASHFRDLYSIYKHWSLAIASYGCSPVMLNKCIRMAGNSLYYWDIYPYIPEPTKDIYPKFIATVYIMNYYREHGIKISLNETTTEETDSVIVKRWLSFQQISAAINIPIEQLRKMNPVFKKDVIPFTLEGYWIRLPKNKSKQFQSIKDTLLYSAVPKTTDFTPVLVQKIETDSADKIKFSVDENNETKKKEEKKFDKQKIIYTVKRNEKINDIADWFEVSVYQIISWNKLKSSKVKLGQHLQIWVKANKTGYYKRINTMSAKQKRKLKNKN